MATRCGVFDHMLIVAAKFFCHFYIGMLMTPHRDDSNSAHFLVSVPIVRITFYIQKLWNAFFDDMANVTL